MKRIRKKRFSWMELVGLSALVGVGMAVYADAVSIPFNFESATTARASEVNSNFQVLADAVTSLENSVSAVQLQITILQAGLSETEEELVALQDSVSGIQSSSAMALNPYLSVEADEINGLSGPHVILSGVNLHLQSGSGVTDDGDDDSTGFVPLGLGNLVVGYNEDEPTFSPSSVNDRRGSHNLVMGSGHRFSSYGGLVGGLNNAISAPFASISGGRLNAAAHPYSSVSGGSGLNSSEADCWAAGTLQDTCEIAE